MSEKAEKIYANVASNPTGKEVREQREAALKAIKSISPNTTLDKFVLGALEQENLMVEKADDSSDTAAPKI